MKPTVLLLSTYPHVEPRHGGQIRLNNIAKAYTDAGWITESVAVYEPHGYCSQQLNKHDIPLPHNSPYLKFHGRDVPLINDLLTGQYAAADDGGFPLIEKNLPKKIDAIHVEQPWLWPLAAKLKQLPQYNQSLLIFGSQNIEAPLKREILNSYNVPDIDDVIEEIEKLEQRAANEADIVIAVTQSDLDILASKGEKITVLAPNGISASRTTKKVIEHWKDRLPKEPWLLYVASAHPPNFTGFTQCVGASLGCIPPTSRLVVVGSVCEHLYNHLSDSKWSDLNLSRLELLGILSDSDLSAVKMLAHAYILPIPHGGGSNIKTAEALYSGAYVIGTEAAFRGFKDFIELPEVIVASDTEAFQSAISDVLEREPRSNDNGKHIREKLLWEKCLSPIPAMAKSALYDKAKQ